MSRRTFLLLIPFLMPVIAPARLSSVRHPSSSTILQGAPLHEVVVQKNIMILMRDGVNLAADVYLPARDGQPLSSRFPAILSRTPYNKEANANEARWFAARGYAVVMNDVRGRYASEGNWRLILDDVKDGYDTVEWIAGRLWCSGKIGTIGTSYPGGTQHALACANPPHLSAMIPVDALSNVGVAGFRHGGAFELRFFNWIVNIGAPNSKESLNDPDIRRQLFDFGRDVREQVRKLPLQPGKTPLRLAPEYEAWLVESMRHGDYDSHWKQPGYSVVENVEGYADVPAYHVTGWYDSWTRQVALNWQVLSRAKRGPHKLIIGPWVHGGQGSRFAGEAEFPPEAALAFNEWRLRWLDHWLKGTDNGVEREPPVRLFVMGGGTGRKTASGRIDVGGRWRDEREFPLARTRYTPYFLHPDGMLKTDRPIAPSTADSFTYDPNNPVPTIGGNISSNAGLMDNGAFDQRCRKGVLGCQDELPLANRKDVLVFQTAPLEKSIEVTGPVTAILWIKSTATDTDFTAKLVDVYPANEDYPNGVALNIGDSIIRTRYRESLAHQKLMQPGQMYQVQVQLYPTSIVFQKGHRIRLDISSSNFPRFDLNPNTGEPLQRHTHQVAAVNTVLHDAAHPSCLVLPVIPRM